MIEYNDGSGWKKSTHEKWDCAKAEADALARGSVVGPVKIAPQYRSYRVVSYFNGEPTVYAEYIGTNHDLPKSACG